MEDVAALVEVMGRRIDRLERQARRWRRVATAGGMLLVASLAIGARRPAEKVDADSVRTRYLAVEDDEGNPMFTFTTFNGTPTFTMESKQSKGLAVLREVDDGRGSLLVLSDSNGQTGVLMSAKKGTGGLIGVHGGKGDLITTLPPPAKPARKD